MISTGRMSTAYTFYTHITIKQYICNKYFMFLYYLCSNSQKCVPFLKHTHTHIHRVKNTDNFCHNFFNLLFNRPRVPEHTLQLSF